MPTILVADDNSNIQKMVSLVFEEKGINVVAVGNGEAACRKVPELKPDIVLADVFMPVRNGYEVCEFVKRDSRFSETPVILLVGAFDPLDEKEAQRVGADGVLKKPFVPPDPLISLVGSLLQKSEKPEEKPAEPLQATPPPPVAVVPPLPTPPGAHVEEEPEPEPEEFSYGVASRNSETSEDMTTTVREPIATPSFGRDKDGEEEDNTSSASDWKRRREAMDYDIPAEESANMVEDLAGTAPQSLQTEEESDGKVGLAGQSSSPASHAETDQVVVSEPAEEPPHTSASEWMSYMAPAETGASAQHAKPERTEADVAAEEPVEYSSVTAEIESPHAEPASANAETHVGEIAASPVESPAPPPDVIPFRTHAQPLPSAETEAIESHREPKPASPVFTPAAEPESAAQSAVERAVHEVIAQPEMSKPAQMDQATIDSIVAKVVERLEPQLHQALSQGVLKPLIQELLKGELKSDK